MSSDQNREKFLQGIVNVNGAHHAAYKARQARKAGDEATWKAERAKLLLEPVVEMDLKVESADTTVLSPAVRALLDALTAHPNADVLRAVVENMKNL